MYFKKSLPLPPDVLSVGFFIREGHRADEIELNGDDFRSGYWCDYFVQMKPWLEGIEGIWKKGSKEQVPVPVALKNRKFKDPQEVRDCLEKEFGKFEPKK